MGNFPSIDAYLRDFQDRLKSADLLPVNSDCTQWEGILHIEWIAPGSGEWQSADHKIAIDLPLGFPYRAPTVQSLDTPKIERSLHLTPSGSLCLWRKPGGWEPFMSGQKFLSRIHQWFKHYHQGDWPEDFAPTDLHLYLPNDGVVIIGEEWMPSREQQVGNFVLWRNSKNRNQPCLVGLKLKTDQAPNREKRLVDALIWNDKHKEGSYGVWFRVFKPFVPDTHLDILLEQIDQASENKLGESFSRLLSSRNLDLTKDIPIAIGYPGPNGQEYWLFLCAKKPVGKKLRLAYLPEREIIEIHSFAVAPARKSDIIRRIAHTSKTLGDKKIILFGVGSLGSSIAILLAKAGLGRISLVDGDNMYPTNAIRHEAGINWTGFRKTTAIQMKINFHNPDCVVTTVSDEAWEKEKILEIAKDANILVDATANVSFSFWLNQIAVENSIPVLFATTYRRASIGRLIFHREHQDPCLACYFLSKREWSEDFFPIIPPDHNLIFGEEGCASTTEEADAINIETIACLTSKVIVEYLAGKETANLLLLVNDPLRDGVKILSDVGLHKLTNQAVENCPICGNIETA